MIRMPSGSTGIDEAAVNGGGRQRLPRWHLAVSVYVVLHLLLDWVSFIHEVPPLNITPWNPQTGLMLGMLIAYGRRMWGPAWVALVAADLLIRGFTVPAWGILLSNSALVAIYGTAAQILRRQLGFKPEFEGPRDVVRLLAAALPASLLSAATYVGVFLSLPFLSHEPVGEVFIRYWVGDIIGVMVVTPATLLALRDRTPRWSWTTGVEFALQIAATAMMLWLDFGPLSSDQYEYFYLLFLPAVWTATRYGLTGAVWTVVVTQIGLIAAIQLTGIETDRMTHFQLLMLALTITTLLLGAVVSERRRVEAWVRDRQAELAHASRLTEAGEMTAALAHEINQPLTATMSYARAARKIAQRDGVSAQLAEIIDKTVAQAERADRVMHSLRDFVRKGESRREPIALPALIADSVTLATPILRQHKVALSLEIAPNLPMVDGNPIQLQQVLLNLLRNAAEALTDAPPGARLVTIKAVATGQGFVALSVRDTGPGLADLVQRNLFAPFVTTKATGMGLGLSIARSIIENHGGTLTGDRPSDGGAIFSFTLPATKPS